MQETKRKTEDAVRINKYLSQAGICSRRQADTYVEEGRVEVDGEVAVSGTKVLPGQSVTFDGKPVKIQEDLIFLAFHKPRGIVCTASKEEKDNIIDYINYPTRIYPVGRLDKDSQGLILLTNDGEAANQIMKARNYHEKEYEVTVNKRITNEFIHDMRNPVPLDEINAVTRRCKVIKEGPNEFRIILTQGLNRQIRRMCEALGYRGTRLRRVRIIGLHRFLQQAHSLHLPEFLQPGEVAERFAERLHFHGPQQLVQRAVVRSRERDDAVPHDRMPESGGHLSAGLVGIGLIGVGDAVIHQPEAQFRQCVIGAAALPEAA